MTNSLAVSVRALGQLTGRSAFKALRQEFLAVRKELELEMDSMVVASKSTESAIYLTKHLVPGIHDYWTLRWRRRYASTKHAHVLWIEQTDVLDAMVPVVKRHFTQLNRRVIEVNALAMMVKVNLKALDAVFKRSES